MQLWPDQSVLVDQRGLLEPGRSVNEQGLGSLSRMRGAIVAQFAKLFSNAELVTKRALG